jgi:hypothetical protein
MMRYFPKSLSYYTQDFGRPYARRETMCIAESPFDHPERAVGYLTLATLKTWWHLSQV